MRGRRRALTPCRLRAFLSPELAIQRAVLDCLADVFGGNGFAAREVGDGACDFEDAIVGAGAEVEAFHGHPQHVLGVGAEGAVFAELLGGHAGVDSNLAGAETLALDFAGGDDALADGGAGFAGVVLAQFFEGDGGSFDVEIDAIVALGR